MIESQSDTKPFELKCDKSKLYSDVLRFVLQKILPGDATPLLTELEKVSHGRWTAVESGDQAMADSLKHKENELVERGSLN